MSSLKSLSPRFAIGPVRMVLAVAVITVLLLGAACGSSSNNGAPTLSTPAQTGQQLVEKYMSLLANQDVAGLKTFLSDSFLRQGADGTFATKDQYLSNLPQVSNYHITDVTANQSGGALAVRWMLSIDEVVSGKTLQTTPAPRLATFVWEGGDWRLLSHANFNAPA